MAKGCPEEFNPWPPFVDIFASVILVLMLFLLITVVNIGYYAQFKSKTAYTAQVTEKAPEVSDDSAPAATSCKPMPKVVVQEDQENKISFRKIDKPKNESSNNSLFSGGQSEGNAVNYINDKTQKVYDNQRALLKKRSLEIFFKDKEIFISLSIKQKIRKFIGDINRITTRSIFTIYVTDPSGIISATLAKQISLGRILNIKSMIKKTNIKGKRIKMNLHENVSPPSAYGSLVIKAMIP